MSRSISAITGAVACSGALLLANAPAWAASRTPVELAMAPESRTSARIVVNRDRRETGATDRAVLGEAPASSTFAVITVSRAADAVGQPVYFSRSRTAGSAGVVSFSPRSMPAGTVFSVALLPRRVFSPAVFSPLIAGAMPSSLPLSAFSMTSGFGLRQHPLLGTLRMHSGIDLAATYGSPIVATSNGVVSIANWHGGYGLFVALDHGNGLETRYGHMSRLNVFAGEQVHRGDVIGYVGSTGLSTGPHVHYEIRLNGQAVNPAAYVRGR